VIATRIGREVAVVMHEGRTYVVRLDPLHSHDPQHVVERVKLYLEAEADAWALPTPRRAELRIIR
jgi:hypothetical protein